MKKDLTQGSSLKHIFELSLPMMLGIFSIMAFNLVDTYFIGQLGARSLAAISFTFPVVMLVGSISFGMTMALTSLVSRLIGEQKHEKVKQTVSDSLFFALFIVIGISLLGQISMNQVFSSLGASQDLIPLIKDYMRIWYYSIIFLLIPMMGNGAIRGLGDTKFPAMVMLVAAGVNAIFDPILIFGKFGFPEMGIKGAAIATVISRVFTLAAGMYVLHFRERLLVKPFKNIEQSIQYVKNLIQLSIPLTLNNIIGPLSIAIITKMVASYGEFAVAGFGVASKLESFITIPIFGFSAGLGPFVGQNFGAQLWQRVRLGISICNKLSSIILAIVSILGFYFAPYICALFNDNVIVIESASTYLRIVSLSYLFLALMANASSALVSMGKPSVSLALTILKMLVLYLPLALILQNMFELKGVFYAASISNTISGIVAFFVINFFTKEH